MSGDPPEYGPPTAPPGDIFGDVIDDYTVEVALRSTLQAWISSHLAHQERRWGRPQGQIERPHTWPLRISEFDLKLHDQLPAVLVIFNGTVTDAGGRDGKGNYREAYSYDIVIAVPGVDELECRQFGSMYIAAVKSALLQNSRLGGVAQTTIHVGPINPNVGRAIGVDLGAERAVYSTTFHVFVRNTVNDRLGPAAPPPDPAQPGTFPPPPDEAEFLVETTLEDPL